jgi:hypothetical protein
VVGKVILFLRSPNVMEFLQGINSVAIIANKNSLSVKEFITDVASGSVLILYVLIVFSMQKTQVSII